MSTKTVVNVMPVYIYIYISTKLSNARTTELFNSQTHTQVESRKSLGLVDTPKNNIIETIKVSLYQKI